MSGERPGQWSSGAKWLHWTTALLVIAQLPLGWVAKTLPLSPLTLDLFVWHKSLGFVILLLATLRLVLRAFTRSPPLPAAMAAWERATARATHAFLYVLLVALPLSGWVVNSAANVPFRIFRQIPVPAIVAPDKAVAELAARIHLGLVVALSVLLAAHVGAALWHHYGRRDAVLARMLPGKAASS